jgi:prepilin-type N-terminal cleavage/methylation domain-containing protein
VTSMRDTKTARYRRQHGKGAGAMATTTTKAGSEAGFSLVELLVALTVTLIVTGAVYGLIASGQSAFRREPELADRQQNARVAMALIEQDISVAGLGLPSGAQVFTATLNGAGPAGALGTAAQTARGDASANTDMVEMVGAEERCPFQTVCTVGALTGVAGAVQTREPIPACMPFQGSPLRGLVIVTDTVRFMVQPATVAAAAACAAGTPNPDSAQNGSLTLAAAVAPWTSATALTAVQASPGVPTTFLYGARIVRYRIGPSGDADNEPGLWRSTSGVYTNAGAAVVQPGESGFPATGSPWQLVAKGVEDLQVEYMYDSAGTITWKNVPDAVANAATVVRQVRVTLSVRAAGVLLQGESDPGAGSTARRAVRGQLVRTMATRPSLLALQIDGQHK